MKKITLDIEDAIWFKFKSIVPSSISLNDAIVELIKEKIKQELK